MSEQAETFEGCRSLKGLRRWNIRHHFVVTYLLWVFTLAWVYALWTLI